MTEQLLYSGTFECLLLLYLYLGQHMNFPANLRRMGSMTNTFKNLIGICRYGTQAKVTIILQ